MNTAPDALDLYVESLADTLSCDPRVAPFRDARTSTEGYLKLEHEIQTLENAVSLLRIRQNDLRPCGRLPPEVLAEIFLFLRCSHPPGHHAVSYGWTAVTRVCRKWRYAALACAALWDRLDFSCARWVERSIERSQHVPLDLYVVDPSAVEVVIRGDGLKHDRFLRDCGVLGRILLEHGHRIRTVHIHGELDDVGPIFPDLFLLIPNVSLCYLRCTSLVFDTTLERLPASLLSLTALRLHNIVVDPPLPAFPSLTYLHLTDAEFGNAFDIVDLIRNTPTLETVILLETLFRHDAFERATLAASAAPVYMPHLRLLRVDDDLQACHALLSALSLPATCTLVAECGAADRQIDWSEDTFLSVVAYLRDHLENARRAGRTSDALDVSLDARASIRAWCGPDRADLIGELSCFLGSDPLSSAAMSEVLRRLPFSDAWRLDLEVPGPVPRWGTLFRSAPELVHLELLSTSLEAVSALAAEPARDSERRRKPRRALLPKLTMLAVEFGERDKKPLFRALRDVIHARNRSKSSERIETLHVYGMQSHTMREIVRELYTIVPRVWWSETGWVDSDSLTLKHHAGLAGGV